MDIRFFAPSYRRPEKSITQKAYPFVQLVVKESEAYEYRQNGNDIVTCPDEVQGNLCRVRNWILKENADADCVILLDDDIQAIGFWEAQKRRNLIPEEFLEFSENAVIMAMDAGVKFWGLNCIATDKGAYREHTPFSFISYIGGPFQAHCKTDLFYDERLPLKEDYDMTLQHLKKYGKVLRFNSYHYYGVKQSEQSGGCATYRNLQREKEQFELLQKKWGNSIITQDKKSRMSFDYNPILKVPLKGV